MTFKEAHLGILSNYNYQTYPPFIEKDFFRVLSIYGQKKDIAVTVFTLDDISWSKNKIKGFRYSSKLGRWLRGDFSLPPVVYDRIFYFNRAQLIRNHLIINRLINQKNVFFLGRGLPGKWKVYEMCLDNPHLLPFLPETIKFNSSTNWQKKLSEHKALFFKPIAGSHGKRVFKLSRSRDGIAVRGRTNRNELFSYHFSSVEKCEAWMRQISERKRYIMQPYLSLNTNNHIPFDIRILVQKNEQGEWAETGRVVRLGKENSLTSNLHGGGTAVKTDQFLTEHYPQHQVEHIHAQLDTIVTHLPRHLEKKHGSLIELGIDVGIDQQVKAWLLEANSKPGRRSFRLTQDKQMFKRSLFSPILYAHYVLSHYGRSI